MQANPALRNPLKSSMIVELIKDVGYSESRRERYSGAYERTLFPDPAVESAPHSESEDEKKRIYIRLP